MNLPLLNMNNVTLFFGGECFLDPSLSRMHDVYWMPHVEHHSKIKHAKPPSCMMRGVVIESLVMNTLDTLSFEEKNDRNVIVYISFLYVSSPVFVVLPKEPPRKSLGSLANL